MYIPHHNGPHARGSVAVESIETAPALVAYPFSPEPTLLGTPVVRLSAHVYALQSLRGGSRVSWAYVYSGIQVLGEFALRPQEDPEDQIGANGRMSDIVPNDGAEVTAPKQSRQKAKAE